MNRRMAFYATFALAFLAFSCAVLPQARAKQITTTGDLDPAHDPVLNPFDWDLMGGDLTVGDAMDGTLLIEGGASVSNAQGTIGSSAGATGISTVSGFNSVSGDASQWNNSSSLVVGDSGNGTLSVTDGGEVSSVGGTLGLNIGSIGTATVNGVGSLWNNNSGNLNVGNLAQGTLNIEAGGSVNNFNGYLGNESGGAGIVNVTGEDSLWTNNRNLYVGHQGMGTLNILAGGRVTDSGANFYDATIGNVAGSSGTVNVSGADSMGTASLLKTSGNFNVGKSGVGELNVGAGGNVNSYISYVGRDLGGVGTATVDGPGALWSSDGLLYVGDKGTGTLEVLNGGQVTVGAGFSSSIFGNTAGSLGTVKVSGAGSLYESMGTLKVGQFGTGILDVDSAGSVTIGSGELGSMSGGDGTGTVTGNGSSLVFNSGGFVVGSFGTGELNILDGGQVASTGLAENHIGKFATLDGADGTVNVSGTNSTLSIARSLYVGNGGEGTLNVSAGGKVTSSFTRIGEFAGSNGIAIIDGVDSGGVASKWETGSFTIGHGGEGELTISNGAEVISNSSAVSLAGNNGMGTVTVRDDFSKWNISGNLDVGVYGTAELNVLAGGLVQNTAGRIALSSGSATANVSGAGSRWENDGLLLVGGGGGGAATLSVSDQGVVTSLGSQVGGSTTLPSSATVADAGSQWDARGGTLIIASNGIGTLNIENGGLVNSTNTNIGGSGNVTGTVNVSGVDSGTRSHLDVSGGVLAVGHNATTGRLDVSAGALVTSENGYVARNANKNGMALVTGAGSEWNNTETLYIGSSGTGTLDIMSGGLVASNDGFLGFNQNGTGTATVAGASTWNNSTGDLTVGNFGTGTLHIESGSAVNNDNAFVGRKTSGSNAGVGTVNISDAGSTWNTTSNLSIGGDSSSSGFSGEVNISDNAAVNVGGTMKLYGPNSQAGSTGGTVNFSGGKLVVDTLDLTASTATENFNMTGGRLVVDSILGDFKQEGGTLAPGDSPGFTDIQNDYEMIAGLVEFEIGGLARGIDFDAIDVGGVATLDGTMDVNWFGTFSTMAMAGDSFQLVNAIGGITGTPTFDFSGATFAASSGLAWDTSQFSSNGTIFIAMSAAVPEPTSCLMFGLACFTLTRRRRDV